MIKWIYIVCVVWTLFPLIIFFVLPGIAALFKKKNIQLIFRKMLAAILGIRKAKINGNYLYQYGNLDCGEVSLRNIFIALGKEPVHGLKLPKNSSMRDLHDEAIKNGLNAIGQKNISLDELKRCILYTKTKSMVLLKVFYPFNGFWVYPTRLFMKFMTYKIDALHWVVVNNVSDKYIYLIDPYFGNIKLTHKKFIEVWNNVILKFDSESEQ